MAIYFGVHPGDVVFCSDLTFAATVNPVCYEHGVPVFIDSERETWNMDPRALELASEKYPNCKTVIVANLYCTPAKLGEISAICYKHGATLIEDTAESLGATYGDRQTRTFGKYTAISLLGVKKLTANGPQSLEIRHFFRSGFSNFGSTYVYQFAA